METFNGENASWEDIDEMELRALTGHTKISGGNLNKGIPKGSRRNTERNADRHAERRSSDGTNTSATPDRDSFSTNARPLTPSSLHRAQSESEIGEAKLRRGRSEATI